LLPALAELPEQQRTAVVLVHGFGWSMADVSRLMGVTHSTTRTHVTRAIARLQIALEVRENAD
jgi:RNA polymerase sigma factor (sigma-70 family)